MIQLSHTTKEINTSITLPASKSESNRALIMQALAAHEMALQNISEARDTQTMQRLLNTDELELNVIDAGTTMRFLTAYCTVTNRESILTGTTRMCERPIEILVNALREIGGDIEYVKETGFPPIHIKGFSQKANKVKVKGDVSSQYISALLLIAPTLSEGLSIELEGKVGSRPYIEMTLTLMKRFGIHTTWEENVIHVAPQAYQEGQYTIESDWSGASYWYSIVALSERAEVTLPHLFSASLQGDRAMADIMEMLGVASLFEDGKVVLTKKKDVPEYFEYDFTECPDVAQTIAVICAAKGITAKLTGLESLRIKETDRIKALQQELQKIGVEVVVVGDNEIQIPKTELSTEAVTFHTYEDHRMAMAFAPLALLFPIQIDAPEVVAKSYPRFWEDLTKAGFLINN